MCSSDLCTDLEGYVVAFRVDHGRRPNRRHVAVVGAPLQQVYAHVVFMHPAIDDQHFNITHCSADRVSLRPGRCLPCSLEVQGRRPSDQLEAEHSPVEVDGFFEGRAREGDVVQADERQAGGFSLCTQRLILITEAHCM